MARICDKNNAKIYEFLAKEAFNTHYMDIIYQMFRTALYNAKDDERFKILRDKPNLFKG